LRDQLQKAESEKQNLRDQLQKAESEKQIRTKTLTAIASIGSFVVLSTFFFVLLAKIMNPGLAAACLV